MKIIVFGATGDTGIQLVEQLLAEGHEVTAFVRNPEKLKISGEKLLIEKGDVLNPVTLSGKINGADAVFSALGGNHRQATIVYSQGIENIITEMQKSGIERLICLSAETLKSKEEATFVERIFIKILWKLFSNLYRDMQQMEQKILSSSLDWTIIRPPRLTNGSKTNDFQMSINHSISKGKGKISRADLAVCMIQQLTNQDSYQSIVYASSK